MPEERQDYLLRLIDELRQFVAEVLGTGDDSKLEAALVAVVQAEEKLFGRPAAEFQFPNVVDQLELLSRGETPESARAKCLAYSSILEQAGLLYEARNHRDLAASAFQLALYVRLLVADRNPPNEDLKRSISALVDHVPPEELHAPVLELLERVNGWS
jgi:hypothetical protein